MRNCFGNYDQYAIEQYAIEQSALNSREVRVTPQQFIEIARLCDEYNNSARLTEAEFVARAKQIEPTLKADGIPNELVVME